MSNGTWAANSEYTGDFTILICEQIGLFLLTLILVLRYSAKNTTFWTKAIALVIWFSSFSYFTMLPYDVYHSTIAVRLVNIRSMRPEYPVSNPEQVPPILTNLVLQPATKILQDSTQLLFKYGEPCFGYFS